MYHFKSSEVAKKIQFVCFTTTPELYRHLPIANGKAAIKDYLQTEVEFFAFTMDNWTSRANDAYLSLTSHFITSRWNMVTCVLATSPFPEHHTADNIVKTVQQVMADYNLEKKHLLSVVHDQCSNMELADDKLHEETGN